MKTNKVVYWTDKYTEQEVEEMKPESPRMTIDKMVDLYMYLSDKLNEPSLNEGSILTLNEQLTLDGLQARLMNDICTIGIIE